MFKGVVWALVSVICWSAMFPVCRKLMLEGDVDPIALGAVRFTPAGLLMLSGAKLFRAAEPKPERRDLAVMALQGALGVAVMNMLLLFAQKSIAAVNASMLEALVPLQICVIGILAGRKPGLIQTIGIAAGFIGCLLVLKVVTFSQINLAELQYGDLMIFLAALCWSIYTVWGRKLIRKYGGYTFSAWTMLFGGLTFAICALASPQTINWPNQSGTWGMIAFLIAFPSILAYYGWNEAQRHISTTLLSLNEYFTPLLTALFAYIAIGETVTTAQAVGAITVVGAVLASPEFKKKASA